MATIDIETGSTELALAFQPPGFEQIPGSTILTRLNYYDGKFLRADDLRLEQNYLRRLVELEARAGGSGLVYGFDVDLGSGDLLTIGGGLAYDGSGRVLYMPAAITVGLHQLIDATNDVQATSGQAATAGSSVFAHCPPEKADPAPPAPGGAEFYVITIAHAEEACGEEDVFGTLCDDGCATTTDRANLVEGIVVRAEPFMPRTPFVTAPGLNEIHIRSQLASAFFADRLDSEPCRISKAGLLSGIWCKGAAAPNGWKVPIAVVGRLSSSTFVDEWIVRRERMETPPRRSWEGRMCMRPWDVFLAQVLQFQCQLPSVLSGRGGDATSTDPCAAHTQVIQQVAGYMNDLQKIVELAPADVPKVMVPAAPGVAVHEVVGDQLQPPGDPGAPVEGAPPTLDINAIIGLRSKINAVLDRAKLPSQQILLDGGLVELPPAGYLPVTIGTTPAVDEQVRRLMGAGVDLRFCVARHDYVPRAFESAQHMDRISLVEGLADAAKRPKVDIIVPDGTLGGTATTRPAVGWDTKLLFDPAFPAFDQAVNVAGDKIQAAAANPPPPEGLGRSALPPAGGAEFTCAVFAGADAKNPAFGLAAYASVSTATNPFQLAKGAAFTVDFRFAFSQVVAVEARGNAFQGSAALVIDAIDAAAGTLAASGRLTALGETNPIVVQLTSNETGFVLEVSLSGKNVDGQPTLTPIIAASVARLTSVPDRTSTTGALSVHALTNLQARFTDQPYATTIEDHLFDPTAGTIPASGVTATLDWVLFHRRRFQDCDIKVVVPPPPKVWTYTAFVAKAANDVVVREITDAIESNNASVLKEWFVPIGEVAFLEQDGSLQTAAGTVLDNWQGATPFIQIVAAVAAGSDEPDTALKGRIAAVQAAVGTISKPVAGEAVTTRPTPASLQPVGPDGQLLFITKPDLVGYEVLASNQNSQTLQAFESEKGSIYLNVERLRASSLTVSLGTAWFDRTTTTMVTADLTTLAEHNPPFKTAQVTSIVALTLPGQTTTEDTAGQTKVIVDAVGGSMSAAATFTPIAANQDSDPPEATTLVCVLGINPG